MPKLHIVCLRPGGMNRGGTRHEGHKVHELEAFSAAQLRDLYDEPNLVLIVGGEALPEATVLAAEAKAAAEAKKAKG